MIIEGNKVGLAKQVKKVARNILISKGEGLTDDLNENADGTVSDTIFGDDVVFKDDAEVNEFLARFNKLINKMAK